MRVVGELRKRRVFNPHGFYGETVYLWYRPRGDSRSMTVPAWMVSKRGLRLGDHWRDYDSRPFHTHSYQPPYDPSKYTGRERGKIARDGALKAAMEWASEKFGVEAWKKDPFGGHGPKEFVERRLKEILEAPEGADMEHG